MLIRIQSGKDNSIQMIQDAYKFVIFFAQRIWNDIYQYPRGFLNKKDIKIILCFQY